MTDPVPQGRSARRHLSLAAFLATQLIVIGSVVAAVTYRYQQWQQAAALPPLRLTPLEVPPRYDYDVIVTDEQLARVLARLVPRDEGGKTKINHVDHALRFWGLDARFDDSQLLSGEEMRRRLTDHRRFVELFGPQQPPLLIDEGPGVRVRVQEGPVSSSHVDHTLASLAEVGTPLDFPLITAGQQTTYRALLEQSLRDFSLNQTEYEWSTLAYVLFLPPTRTWMTREGQQMDFDRLARRLMREEMPQGVCFGNHRLHTLAMMLRVHEQLPILEEDTLRQIHAYLAEMTTRLVQHQHPDGFWNQQWPTTAPESSEPSKADGDLLRDRILATGHALEWWATAPEDLHPPRAVLVAAGQWLVKTVDSLSPAELQDNYTYLTHVGRALAIWRGITPAKFRPRA